MPPRIPTSTSTYATRQSIDEELKRLDLIRQEEKRKEEQKRLQEEQQRLAEEQEGQIRQQAKEDKERNRDEIAREILTIGPDEPEVEEQQEIESVQPPDTMTGGGIPESPLETFQEPVEPPKPLAWEDIRDRSPIPLRPELTPMQEADKAQNGEVIDRKLDLDRYPRDPITGKVARSVKPEPYESNMSPSATNTLSMLGAGMKEELQAWDKTIGLPEINKPVSDAYGAARGPDTSVNYMFNSQGDPLTYNDRLKLGLKDLVNMMPPEDYARFAPYVEENNIDLTNLPDDIPPELADFAESTIAYWIAMDTGVAVEEVRANLITHLSPYLKTGEKEKLIDLQNIGKVSSGFIEVLEDIGREFHNAGIRHEQAKLGFKLWALEGGG